MAARAAANPKPSRRRLDGGVPGGGVLGGVPGGGVLGGGVPGGGVVGGGGVLVVTLGRSKGDGGGGGALDGFELQLGSPSMRSVAPTVAARRTGNCRG